MAVGELAALLPGQPAGGVAASEDFEGGAAGARPSRGHAPHLRIDPAGLGQIRAWLDRFWDQSLAAFAAAAEREDEQ